ncbi:GntR family transcriptional regulator [Roseibium aquae]|uniref:Pyruvate dehydrogenase complex repressor n=1 Tax=Roseibium aquae TaxID=1323746 RepID=A0A916TLH3_9HYPH|nr:FCD domain-containing protein [Roseibium aquae]GGB52869.1 GntR family transcriptional regulator [Roseibium aquae]
MKVGPVFKTISHARTADAVIHQVEEYILNGVLRPADRLPAERDLSEQMNVSRPVVRDALKALEQRGLIVSRQGGGTYVADVIGPIFSDPIVALIERHPAATADYLEFRRDIEGIAAAHAAERATEADRSTLTSLTAAMTQAYAQDDPHREAELDVEFHHAVGEAAHNVILLHALRSCYRLLENGVFYNRKRLYSHPFARERVLEQHRSIADHIVQGRPAEAKRASEEHIDFVASALADVARLEDRRAVADLRQNQRRRASASTK